MKKILTFYLVALGLLIFSSSLSSCKKDAKNYTNSLAAIVDGISFTSVTTTTDAVAQGGIGSFDLYIHGTSSSGKKITIFITDYSYSGYNGIFTVGGVSGHFIGVYNAGAGSVDKQATSGQVTITNNYAYGDGKVLEGNFNFTGSGYIISNGTFSVFVHN